MARVPHTNPDGVKSIDDLVATLLLMGIDVNNARTRANVLAAAAAAANGTGPTISVSNAFSPTTPEDAASGETATTEAIPAPAPNIGNTPVTLGARIRGRYLATSAGDTEATQAGSARATSATLDWAMIGKKMTTRLGGALSSGIPAPQLPLLPLLSPLVRAAAVPRSRATASTAPSANSSIRWGCSPTGTCSAPRLGRTVPGRAQAAFDEALAAGLVMVVTPSPVTLPTLAVEAANLPLCTLKTILALQYSAPYFINPSDNHPYFRAKLVNLSQFHTNPDKLKDFVMASCYGCLYIAELLNKVIQSF
ncbi:hypothetical protein BJ912DRAFT_933126 [Pholiota molesta]|nr:hypothetical protein BJ912DRAFT_933126 [Pholiota molesta]